VAFERKQRIVAAHAGTVVGHANQAASARADFDGDFLRAGIERIFHQLLHNARGPLDHFAGGDLVGDLFGKQLDAVHPENFKSGGANVELKIGEAPEIYLASGRVKAKIAP
jgi:hypothetical protein